jgi:hypothetical protein
VCLSGVKLGLRVPSASVLRAAEKETNTNRKQKDWLIAASRSRTYNLLESIREPSMFSFSSHSGVNAATMLASKVIYWRGALAIEPPLLLLEEYSNL